MFPTLSLVTFVESVNGNENLIEVLTYMQQCELDILYLRPSVLLPELRVKL